MTRLNASAPTRDLWTSFARAGWGELAGREWQGLRSVLRGLIDLLPYGSGEGWITAPQVADAAGLSERWTRHVMHELEDLGLVRWTRGGVADGAPQPSWVRIDKKELVRLIKQARRAYDAMTRARRAVTRERIKGLRWARQERRRRSGHAELDTSPRSPTGGVSTGATPTAVDNQKGAPVMPQNSYIPARGAECVHGFDATRTTKAGEPVCPDCRRATRRKAERAQMTGACADLLTYLEE